MEQNQIQKYLKECLAIVHEVSAYIHEEAGNLDSLEIEEKSINSLVSKVDKTAEKILVDKLSLLIPEAGFVTEEDTLENFEKEFTWILDPLDGTTNFLKGIPHYSISVALYHNKLPLIGIVADVERNEIYYATKGGGAFCSGMPLKVSTVSKLSKAIVASGFPYEGSKRMSAITVCFIAFVQHARGVRRFGSAALDLCFVARGWFDGYYETSLNPWDIAAGILIVQEAGGKLSGFTGLQDFYSGDQIVSSNGPIHQEMLDLIEEFYV